MATTTTTNSKLNITQAEALRWLIDNASADAPADVITAAERLYTTKTKKYERKDNAPTKTQIINKGLARDVFTYMVNHGEPVTAKDISYNVRDIRTPQKAVAVVKLLIADGSVARVVDEHKKTWYQVVTDKKEE